MSFKLIILSYESLCFIPFSLGHPVNYKVRGLKGQLQGHTEMLPAFAALLTRGEKDQRLIGLPHRVHRALVKGLKMTFRIKIKKYTALISVKNTIQTLF